MGLWVFYVYMELLSLSDVEENTSAQAQGGEDEHAEGVAAT